MAYRELPLPAELASHVACVWVRTGPPGRVLPDSCADVVWTGSELIVAGPATRPVHPALPADEAKLGIRFKVGAAGEALGLPAAEVLQRFLALAARGGELARLAAEAGYADQPHLTRDCVELTGLPAAALLATGALPAGERLRGADQRPAPRSLPRL